MQKLRRMGFEPRIAFTVFMAVLMVWLMNPGFSDPFLRHVPDWREAALFIGLTMPLPIAGHFNLVGVFILFRFFDLV
jgi:hypothetical protein